MGLRFRKSVKAGPFRVNFSKSGVGYSAGVKGFRITKTAKGRIRKTTSIPGTGISYVTEKSTKTSKKEKNTQDISLSTKSTSSNGKKPNKGIWFKVIFILIFLLFIYGSATGGGEKIEKIELSAINSALDINDKEEIKYSITPNDASLEEANLKSDNNDIAKLVYEGSLLYIQTSKEGKVNLWIEKDDVTSNKIQITVIDKDEQVRKAKEKEEAELKKKQEEEQKIKEKAEQVEVEQKAKENATKSNNQPSSSQDSSSESNTNVVYIAGSGNGTKYHSNSRCSRMKNPVEISLSDAQSRGYEPCSKCY